MLRECALDAAHFGRVFVVVRDRESLSHGEGRQLMLLACEIADHSEVNTFDNQ